MELPINHFKHALRKGQPQIGLWSNLTSHISTEILADCGFDWLLLDMEHAPNELPQNMKFDAKRVQKFSQNRCQNSFKTNAKTVNEKDQ